MSVAVIQPIAIPASAERKDGYAATLKSAASIGGASVVNILLGIIRTKCVAVLLGPAGIGLMGAYASITSLISAVAGMGVQNSGVRQIAEAAGEQDQRRVALVIATVRRATWVLGMLGALAMVGLAPMLSEWTFGNREHTMPLAILGLTVLFGTIAAGEVALIQGLRRIGDLVRVNVVGALLGTLVSVPMVWLWGIAGIVPLLATVALLSMGAAWWYARRVPVERVRVNWGEMVRECRPLLRLGFVFMSGGLLALVGAYLLRIIVVRRLGIEAVGQYQAASNLASIYVGFVLAAMGTDFFPRLTVAAKDDAAMNRMLNEQTEVSLLLAAPGIAGTLALAPVVIAVFYSGSFDAAAEVLRWQALGILLRVVSWPFGFAVLAKGYGKMYFWTELAGNAVHLGVLWAGVVLWGLSGTGIAFAVLYAFYWLMMYCVVRGTTGFAYTLETRRVLAMTAPLVVVAFLAGELVPGRWAMVIMVPVTGVLTWCCGNRLAALVPESRPALAWKRVRRLCLISR